MVVVAKWDKKLTVTPLPRRNSGNVGERVHLAGR